jgi:hypothetical protein
MSQNITGPSQVGRAGLSTRRGFVAAASLSAVSLVWIVGRSRSSVIALLGYGWRWHGWHGHVRSASGMATGDRVVHHLKAFAPDARNMVLLAGFVVNIDAFSAHADSG